MITSTSAKSQFFSSRLFNDLCSYLKYKDLTFLMLASKSVYVLVDEYLNYFLKRSKLIQEDSFNVLDSQGQVLAPIGLQKYNLIYRYFFYQELKVTILSGKEFDPSSNNLVLQTASHKGIKDLFVGHKFSGFLTVDNVLYYAKTNEFLDPKTCILASKQHVVSFSAHRNIVYLTEFGQVFIIFYVKGLSTLELTEDLILFTLEHPINRFFSSYNFVLLLRENNQNEKQPEIYVYDLLGFDLQKINEPNRLKPISIERCPEFNDVNSCVVGSNVAYFLTKENRLYLTDLRCINDDRNTKQKIVLTVFDFFKNKQISQIYSSFLSYFAIEQEKILTIDQWDNKSVLEWATNVGFPDCVKLLKFHKVEGTDLLTLDRKFLYDTLGIKSEEIQNRFLREIEKKRVVTYKPQKLYAWGNNSNGQLGCFAGNNVAAPMKVSLPGIEEDDQIEKIEIGWVTSGILTKKKRLWISEAVTKNKAPVIIENGDSAEKFRKKDKENNRNNKEEKKFLVFNGTSHSKNHKWIDVTEFYSNKNKNKTQIIRNISIAKETFVVVVGSHFENEKHHQVVRKNSCKSGEFPKKPRKNSQKMKSASFIVSQLRWNQNIKKNEWKVGVEMANDSFEMKFTDFEIQEVFYGLEDSVIRYFKREGQMVWDKHSKIDNF